MMDAQLEFVDFSRDRARPPGGGQVIDGFFVYNALAQTVQQVAYTLLCDVDHIYHHIQDGSLPGAVDISRDAANRACYRIPREDVIEFIRSRKEGSGI